MTVDVAAIVVVVMLAVLVALLIDEEKDALLALTACKYLASPTLLESENPSDESHESPSSNSFKRRSSPGPLDAVVGESGSPGPLDAVVGAIVVAPVGAIVVLLAFPVAMVVVVSHEQESTDCDGTPNN